jgi:hypothetical protein
MHVHVISPNGEAKYWMAPQIELASQKGLETNQLSEISKVIHERQNEIRDSWRRHFQS